MYFLICVLLCVCSGFVSYAFGNRKTAYTMFITQAGIILILYWGYLIDCLEGAFYFTILLFLSLLVIAVVKTCKSKSFLTTVTTLTRDRSLIIYLVYLGVAFAITRNVAVYYGDELLYWGALPKVLYYFHGAQQMKMGFQVWCVDYMPAMPLYGYFMEMINGGFKDAALYFAYAALSGAILLPISDKVRKWYEGLAAVGVMYIAPLVFFNTRANDYAVFYKSLYVDPIVGISVGVFVWLFFLEPWKKQSDKAICVFFGMLACVIVMLKSSGISFILLAYAVLCIYLICKDRESLKSISFWVMICLPFVIYICWHGLMNYYGIVNTVDYQVSDIQDIGYVGVFWNAICKNSILTPYINEIAKYCTFLSISLFCLLLMIFVFYISKKRTDRNPWLPYILLMIECIVFLAGLYVLCVGAWQHRLSSYERYVSTIPTIALTFCLCRMMEMFTTRNIVMDRKKSRSTIGVKAIGGIVLVGIVILLPLKTPENLHPYPEYIYDDKLKLCEFIEKQNLNGDSDTWATITLLIDEDPLYDNDHSWIKGWYGHLRNNLSYALIESSVQINLQYLFTSQIEDIYEDVDGTLSVTFDNSINLKDTNYVLWCHGHYTDTPITSYEMYQVQKNDNTFEMIHCEERK